MQNSQAVNNNKFMDDIEINNIMYTDDINVFAENEEEQ